MKSWNAGFNPVYISEEKEVGELFDLMFHRYGYRLKKRYKPL